MLREAAEVEKLEGVFEEIWMYRPLYSEIHGRGGICC
jgi:hypothetical protein